LWLGITSVASNTSFFCWANVRSSEITTPFIVVISTGGRSPRTLAAANKIMKI
jgi:hypothetical protein